MESSQPRDSYRVADRVSLFLFADRIRHIPLFYLSEQPEKIKDATEHLCVSLICAVSLGQTREVPYRVWQRFSNYCDLRLIDLQGSQERTKTADLWTVKRFLSTSSTVPPNETNLKNSFRILHILRRCVQRQYARRTLDVSLGVYHVLFLGDH